MAEPVQTQQELDQEAEYAAAFGDDGTAPVEQDENAAMGIEPPDDAVAAAANAAQSAEEGAKSSDVATKGVQNEIPDAPADPVVSAPVEKPEDLEYPEDPKELQRVKSWEGRLKKLENELMAKKSVPDEKGAQTMEILSEKAQTSGNEELADAAKSHAEHLEDGNMTLEQAMTQLEADFGAPFVKMIESIASAKATQAGKTAASDAVGTVDKQVKDIISHISDSAEQSHFEKIADAVPDFNDIRQTPEFAAFVEAGGEKRQATASSGNAKDVIKMLNAFKAGQAKAIADKELAKAPTKDPAKDMSIDAAAGVRSGGMQIPKEPAAADDFAGAWNEAD